jgi:signal transduction histidine kinase
MLVALTVIALGDGSYTERLDRVVFELVIVVPPIAVGLYAARFPRHARFGLMLLGAGLAWSLTALASSSQSLPYSIGRVAAWLMFPALMYLILAFPDGRLAPGRDRRLFLGVTVVIAVLFVGSSAFVDTYPVQTPWATCNTDCPANAFLVPDAEPAVMDAVVRPLREGLAVLLLIGVVGSLATRTRAATPLRRRTSGPVLIAGLIWTVVLVGYLVARWLWPGAPAVDTLGIVWALCFPGIALAFFAGLLRRRLLVGEVLGSLTVALSGRLDGRHLRDALAVALSDPALDLLAAGPDPSRWRDTDGHVMPGPGSAEDGRAVTLIGDGEARAALVHDAGLSDDAELLDVISLLARSTLEHARLEQELDTSRVQLERSRSRIARAADLERSRIERDLHDGAQQRLILLRIKLSLLEELMRSDPSAVAAAVHALGDEVELTLDELRALAHGVYPSILSDRGLADALRSLAIGVPLPVHLLTHDVQRYSAEVETAVYFACAEAIQNAIKHATGTTALWITLHENTGLEFEVRDEGPGFDLPTGEYNGGLRNMRDRLEAVGGRLTIDSSRGHGARIHGRVPLG